MSPSAIQTDHPRGSELEAGMRQELWTPTSLSLAADPPPPCPPTTRAPPWHGRRARPGEPCCPPCPTLAAAGGQVPDPGWVGRGLAGRPVTGTPGRCRPWPGTARLPDVAICPGGALASARGAEGPGGGSAAARGGGGGGTAVSRRAGTAGSSPGWTWARSVKAAAWGSRTQHPRGLPCAAAPRPREGSRIKQGTIPVPSPSPSPRTHGDLSAAPPPWVLPHPPPGCLYQSWLGQS